jgi:riboflavin synthase
MFTGLVEEAGIVTECAVFKRSAKLAVSAPLVSEGGVHLGDSIAVNGCCLTVIGIGTGKDQDVLTFDAVPETLARTNLGCLRPGDQVNLERPLQIGARLGGHFVQGHIDDVGTVLAVTPDENAVIIEIEVPEHLSRYIVAKGSVTVDGVSLTVAEVRPRSFTVWTIPHTREVTTLGRRRPGDSVNIECDLLGKYVERLLQAGSESG